MQVKSITELLTYIKLPFVIKIFVLSIFEWPFYTGFTVHKIFSMTRIKSLILMIQHNAYFYIYVSFSEFGVSVILL